MRKFLFQTYQTKEKESYLIYDDSSLPEKEHHHDFVELVYQLSGCIKHTIDDDEFECYRGDFLLIDTESTHSFIIKDTATYFNLCLRVKNEDNGQASLLIKDKDKLKNRIISFSGDERREIESILQNMYIEERSELLESDAIYDSYFNILSIKIIRKMYEKGQPDYSDWNLIIQYIEDNLDEQLSLRSVASKCFYNPSYFSRLFKSKVGKTFISYVNERKINKAKEYLEKTNLSIEEIGKSLGFSSVQTFYKTYATFEKVTPIQYRERCKKKLAKN